MSKFCPKCGKSLKPQAKFCASCGTVLPKKVAPPPPPPPPPARSSGCGTGCLIGCLITIVVFILIIGLLILGGYLFFRSLKDGKEPGEYFSVERSTNLVDCEDSLVCLEKNFKSCNPAAGETDLGEFAVAEFEVVGPKGSSCVIYFKITELKELPPEADWVPSFVLEGMLENLSMECLVPSSVYEKGMEGFTEYIEENMEEVCKGPLFDLMDKFDMKIED